MTKPGARPLLPIACTLGVQDGAQRIAEWRRLIAEACVSRAAAPGSVRLRFSDRPDVGAELERLVTAETECCAFLGWDLAHDATSWVLTVSGSPEELCALPL